MTGVYFTDRYTKGDMTMELVDRSTGHPSFKAAQEHRPKIRRWGQRVEASTALPDDEDNKP